MQIIKTINTIQKIIQRHKFTHICIYVPTQAHKEIANNVVELIKDRLVREGIISSNANMKIIMYIPPYKDVNNVVYMQHYNDVVSGIYILLDKRCINNLEYLICNLSMTMGCQVL